MNEIKKDMKEYLLKVVRAFASIIPVTLYFYGLIIILPVCYVKSYDKFLAMGLTDLHATNVATIFAAFASVVGLIVMYKIDKILKEQSPQEKAERWQKEYNAKEAKAQDQAQNKTSNKNLSKA